MPNSHRRRDVTRKKNSLSSRVWRCELDISHRKRHRDDSLALRLTKSFNHGSTENRLLKHDEKCPWRHFCSPFWCRLCGTFDSAELPDFLCVAHPCSKFTRSHDKTRQAYNKNCRKWTNKRPFFCVYGNDIVSGCRRIWITWRRLVITQSRSTSNIFCCRMTIYELLRWLVETPSRDIRHYRMLNASRSTVQHSKMLNRHVTATYVEPRIHHIWMSDSLPCIICIVFRWISVYDMHHYWHCPNSMRSRVHETNERPFVRLSVCPIDR